MNDHSSNPKSSVKLLIAAAVLCAAAIILYAVFFMNAAKPAQGEKNITVQVIHGDGSSKDFSLQTDAEYLGGALVEGKVVEDNQSTYGLYILTADGETADESNQEWWKITKGGEQLNTGADSTPIADGDAFELTLTVGYDG